MGPWLRSKPRKTRYALAVSLWEDQAKNGKITWGYDGMLLSIIYIMGNSRYHIIVWDYKQNIYIISIYEYKMDLFTM